MLDIPTLLTRFDALPDAWQIAKAEADAGGGGDAERVAKRLRAEGKPFRMSIPFRSPPEACPSCGEAIPRDKVGVFLPVGRGWKNANLWQKEIHRARVHGEPLPKDVAALLEALG